MTKDICKLTHEKGRYVDAHLIPKALTRPEEVGVPFVQFGGKRRPIRRWSSWYDKHLVCASGEEILARLDSWAIDELRRLKLVWSGWGPMKDLGVNHKQIPGTSWGIREVETKDSSKLRLFFLSLLWRAAATNLSEFSEINIPEDDLDSLRKMIVNSISDPLSFYPAQLTQLSSFGIIHNHTPIATTKIIPAYGEIPETVVPIFRFYFDGLIVHIARQSSDDGSTEKLGRIMVGYKRTITVSTITFEDSFQLKNLRHMSVETANDWPGFVNPL